ncbi:DUF192 domain-containing protein [Maribacter sp. MMG018]|uniref:DUF192 domain-containing protein n=1 Tax=Maribacter sp. MMG018 TaxID=2822688 RepID=UPI001B3808BB|nr:DUF192 domain-containing protein [Maribacter sp. MMG018]MBQ4914288.1 DUF192 domain-containing protein [Maribacter sp. MMG018]
MRTYYFYLIATAVCTTSLVSSCKQEEKKVIKTEPVSFTKEGELTIYRAETDSLLTKIDIEIAESDYETQTGLMYRKGMENKQGMLFIFSDVAMHSFYMKNTEFPLDIIYIDENLKIASIHKNAEPLNEDGISSQVPVQYVLEINAGLSDTWKIKVGDKIDYTRK